jgi:hypothetical protein
MNSTIASMTAKQVITRVLGSIGADHRAFRGGLAHWPDFSVSQRDGVATVRFHSEAAEAMAWRYRVIIEKASAELGTPFQVRRTGRRTEVLQRAAAS